MTSPSCVILENRKQRTLSKPVSFSGIGIHTGKNVTMRFRPSEESSGIIFQRVDLPGHPTIPATLQYVVDTSRSTNLGIGDMRIYTVEHVMAALRAYQIDNLLIEVNNMEPPVGNGSSDVFIQMIEEAGITEQKAVKPIYVLQEPVILSEGGIHLIALPSPEYRISYTLSYPGHPILNSQFHSISLSADSFKNEIASCRTFSLYQEVAYLMDKGLIRGGSLDNAVVVHDKAVYSKGGLFFKNEMVRHKILDLIGDLSLTGLEIRAHIISHRSGHPSNYVFAQCLDKALRRST